MGYVARLGTWQRFVGNRSILLQNQVDFAKSSARLNSGQRLLNNYDQINGAKDLTSVTGKLAETIKRGENATLAVTELELAESSLNNIKDIMDQLKDDALLGASDTTSNSDRQILGTQLRNLGENLYQLANTKVGNKYVFSGVQSNLKVIDHTPGGIFENAAYKEGNADISERVTEGIQSSVGLSDFFTAQSSSAIYTGSAPGTLPLASNAELHLIINDGTQDINVGDIALSAGDSLANIVTKINNAFNTAGGQGSIAQINAGKLEFDTSLVSTSVNNAAATIAISPGSNLPNTLSDLGLATATAKGTSANIREVMSRLEEAYNSNDSASLRNLIIDLDQNINKIINTKSKLGDLVSKFNGMVEKNHEQKIDFQIKQSDIAKLPIVEAIEQVNKTQAVLQATLRSSSTIISQNIFDFLNL